MRIYRWPDGRHAREWDADEHAEVREIEVEIHADRHQHIWAESDGRRISLTSSERDDAWAELERIQRAARDDAAMDRAEARAERW